MTLSSDIAPLFIIDYALLIENNQDEFNRFYQASTDLGFFYLKLAEEALIPTSLFDLAQELFDLPLETKMNFAMDGKNGVYFGYKSAGSMYTDSNGTPDSIEFWNLSKDEILIDDQCAYPSPIVKIKSTIQSYIRRYHEITSVLLRILSMKLGLDPTRLPSLHRINYPSGDQLRLTKTRLHPTNNDYDKQCIALGEHTDFGSITVLFNNLRGLQVLMNNGDWLYVEPLPGHAIINLGDSLVKLSHGILKSSTHRVVSIHGTSYISDRYSVVYFARPENNVPMKSIIDGQTDDNDETSVLTTEEWIKNRVKYIQTANYRDETTFQMSRGTENRGSQLFVSLASI